jgi:serine/threonine-protein kinase
MRYNIAKRLSSGAFGTVYGVIGEDNNKYALKELKNFDKTNKGRFEREIKILSQLNHRNIIKIIQWNIGGDPPNFIPYYVMEYLSGGSLRQQQHMEEKFSHGYVFGRKWTINRIILPVCNALAQAHTESIYHRDLKPDNIMYTNSSRSEIKITDWGLGKDVNRESIALTAAIGELGGTPGYCAAEQWFTLEDIIDGRVDIFSLGVIFYEMMTGKRPVVFDESDIMMKKKMRIDLPSKYHPTISPKLDHCILKMIDIKPENRFQSVWDVISEIEILPDNY